MENPEIAEMDLQNEKAKEMYGKLKTRKTENDKKKKFDSGDYFSGEDSQKKEDK